MQGLKMLRTAAGTSVIAAACLAPSAHAAAGAGNAVCSTANGTTSCTYPYIGDTQLFQVPRNVTSLHIVAYGAAGGWIEGNATGLVTESKVTADIPVVYRQALEVVVGGQGGTGSRTLAQNNQFYGNLQQGGAGGYNGGGPGGFGVGNGTAGPSGPNGPNRGGGGGGGATDIRMGDNTCVAMGNCPLSRRVLVAGGAGGLSGNYDTKSHAGGLPGYTAGKHGASIYSDGSGAGQGGTQAAGGAGGPVLATGCKSGTAPAGDGALGVGGAGGQGGNTASQSTATGQVGNTGYGGSGGGGGGGGYYGGGGGGGGDCSQGWGSGGGGGSNFGPAGTTYDLATTMNWNGSVVISYTPQPTAASSNPTAKHHHKKKRHHKKKHHQKSHY